MLPPETIRKFFLEKQQGWMNHYEKKYQAYNQIDGRTFEDYIDHIFSLKYFGLPDDKDTEAYLTRDISFLTQENIRYVFQAAQRIIDITNKNDNIVIFGNTPYFVGRAIELILKQNPDLVRNVIFFPFSGSPNRTRLGSFPTPNDIVTIDRLNHLKERLTKHGLMADNADLPTKTTYFVDIIASGAGPAYTIETILRNFQVRGERKIPDIRLISLNEFILDVDEDEDDEYDQPDPRHALVASHNAKDKEGYVPLNG